MDENKSDVFIILAIFFLPMLYMCINSLGEKYCVAHAKTVEIAKECSK